MSVPQFIAPSDERAVNTAVDVSFALLFIGAAVTALTVLPPQNEDEYDPHQAEYTTETLGSSTINVTYSVASVETFDGNRTFERNDQLRRERHGSIASLIADAAVAKSRFEDGPQLTSAGTAFQQALNGRVQTALVESSFETNVTARWEPFDGASVWGEATVGQAPPDNEAVSTATMRVASGTDPVRAEATKAVENGGRYGAIADLLAEAVITEYLPQLQSKHALERSDAERTVTRQRYERVARGVDDTDPEDDRITSNIQLHSVDTAAVNEYLRENLADQFEAKLAATYDSPVEAASAVSVGEVTIAVRTWEP